MKPFNQTYRAHARSSAALRLLVVTLAGTLLLACPLLSQQPGVVTCMLPHPLPQIVNPESPQRTAKQQQQLLGGQAQKAETGGTGTDRTRQIAPARHRQVKCRRPPGTYHQKGQ
jgi:hypothetical protein